MFNLKKYNGSYKGLIGECMFKLTRKWAVLVKCWNKDKYLKIFNKYLTRDQYAFIDNYWHSLDSLEICFVNGRKELRIYEIKTKNEYNRNIGFKPKITASTVKIYEFAKSIGFIVYYVKILFKNHWDYDIVLSEFDVSKFCIDKPKMYDKK